MKIMQVMAGKGRGGLEKHFIELVNALARNGHEVIAVAHANFRDCFVEGVRHIPLDLSASRRNPFILLTMYRLIEREAPDIIHAQANKAAAMLSPLQRLLRPKMVATLHNLKRNTAMFRSFDVLIAVSHAITDPVDHSDLRVVYNGIAPIQAPSQKALAALRKSLNVADDLPITLSVGRLVTAKGFDLLLNAWQTINATLLIAGDGPERALLEAQTVRLGITDRVHFLGMRNDVSDLMALSDMTVIASRNEGFPYVMVEALHMRCPVVSTMISDAGKILPPDYLVPLEDVVSLQATLKRALTDPSALAKAYEPVFSYASRELSLDGMVDKTTHIYAELMDKRHSGAKERR